MQAPKKLAIGIPAYGGSITSYHAKMLIELGNAIGANHERWQLGMISVVDVNPVDKARNMLLAGAMVNACDWLLMIDADTWVEGYGDEDAGFQLLRMISDAHRLQAAVVAAAVAPRSFGIERDDRVMVYRQGITEAVPSMLRMNEVSKGRSLQPCDAAATAVFAVNIPLAISSGANFAFTPSLSEDLEFCRRVREAKGAIYCDPRVRTGHTSKSMPLYNNVP